MLDVGPIEARLAAATGGTWTRHGANVHQENVGTPLFVGRDGSAEARRQADADAEFVAHAHSDIAELLAETKRLRDNRVG
jgi:hypothetical protein